MEIKVNNNNTAGSHYAFYILKSKYYLGHMFIFVFALYCKNQAYKEESGTNNSSEI